MRSRCLLLLLFFAILLGAQYGCRSNSPVLSDTKKIPGYPSASGLEYLDGHYYVIGDDAAAMLVLDSSLQIIDSIPVFPYPAKRIPKAIKPDLESIALLPGNKLLLCGSGAAPSRNKGWIFDPSLNKTDSIRLDTFYHRIQQNGIAELNIEGITAAPGFMVLSNRGSKGYPKNHLIITENRFWEKQTLAPISTVLTGTQPDSNSFNGISGLAYAKRKDLLLMTVSTEDTWNKLDDGSIGKSYLWIIRNISSKKNWKAINPNHIIDLETADPAFRGQKIESVCVSKETEQFLYLTLAADNDDGTSTLFRLVIPNR
ncbi:MAG: DUF6929 family protein [Chitinophagaceae bacterium]